jgi:phosphate transport system substrate-binding protein
MPSSSPANPYIVGPPVTDQTKFFGREDIIQEIEQILRYPTRNWVILYGQRRIGKTSLLRQLEQRLPTPPFFTVYVDLAGKELLPLGRALRHMAAAAAEKAGMPTPVPEAFQNNPALFHEKFLPALYQAVGSQRRPIFLLDEFNILTVSEKELAEDTAIRSLDRYLYNVLTTQTYTDFIFAAGRRMKELSSVVESRFKPDLARFVSVLSSEQARALILQNGSKALPRYDEAAIERIIAVTRGHPYLTQLLCRALFERTVARSRRDPRVKLEDVEAVLPGLLGADQNDLGLIWESMPAPERLTLAVVAGQTGEGETVDDAVITETFKQAGISAKTRGLSQAPENLVNWQMLEQSGGDYRFFIEFMRRWTARERPLAKVKREEFERLSPAAEKPTPAAEIAPAAGRRWLWPVIVLGLLLLLLFICTLGGYNPFGAGGGATATAAAQNLVTPTALIAAEVTPTATPNGEETIQETATAAVTEPAATLTAETVAEATTTNTVEAAVTEETEMEPEAQPTPVEQPLSGQIHLAGSILMQPLIEALTLAFTAQRPNVQIVIQGGDSQTGLEAVRQGSADAGLVARELDASELTGLQVHTLAQNDIIALIVHPLVQLDSLTTGQVRAIFAGEITNWAEVGGADAPIRVVASAEGSGERATFERIIMGQSGLITGSVLTETSDEAVRSSVASRPYAIGFIGLGNATASPTLPPDANWAVLDTTLLDVKLLALDGVAPSPENAAGKLYPLVRPLNLVTQNQPNALVEAWLEFMMSPEGQQIIADMSNGSASER